MPGLSPVSASAVKIADFESGAMTSGDRDDKTLAVHRTIEQAARDSYGRLLAFLAARSRNVAAAEDALGDAFRTALETWPQKASLRNPRHGCWLQPVTN